MPVYNLNNQIYDIPDSVVADFEKDNPTATISYKNGEDIYDIPVSEKNGFLKQFPNAVAYTEDSDGETKKVGDVFVGGTGTQEEADAIFEENARRFREMQTPIQAVSPSNEIDRLKSIRDTAQKEIDASSFTDRFFNNDTKAAVAARNAAEEALETYEEAQHADNGWFDRNVMGVIRGIGDKIGDLSTWDFGASGVSSAVALNDAYKKWENGEQLSPSEQNMLDAYGLAAAVQAEYQDKVGMAYKVGGSLPESASFGLSLALNPAAGVGKKVAEKAAKAAVKKYGTTLVSKLAKGAARVGGDVAEMAVATAVPGAGRVAEDYYNRLNGQSIFDVDDNGIVRYGGQVDQEDADKAIWKAFGSQFIENYSESMGNYFAPMGNMLSNLTAKGLKAANLGKVAEAITDISSSQFSKGIQRFKDAVKFDGFVGEYLEEVAGNFMNAATVGDMNFNSPDDPRSVFNPETNIETALSCALLSGTMYAVEAPVAAYNKYVPKRKLRNAENKAQELLGGRWADLKEMLDTASPQHLTQLVIGVHNATDLTFEQKNAVKDYVTRLVEYQAYNARMMQNANESTKETAEANKAYEEGTSNDTPQFVFKANRMRNQAADALKKADESVYNGVTNAIANGQSIDAVLNGLDESVADLARDYYNKEMRMRGVLDGVMDRAEDAIEEETRIIRDVTNKQTGLYTEINRVVVDENGEQIEQPGYVVGWIGEGESRSPIFLPEGVENKEENRIPLKPTDYNPESLMEMPMDDVINSMAEIIREQAQAGVAEKSKYAPEVLNAQMVQGQPIDTPSEQIIPISPMPEGNGWVVEVYAKDTNNKVAAKPEVKEMTTKEFRDILQAQLDAEEAAIKAEQAVVEEQQQVAPQAEEIVAEQPTIATEETAQPVVEEQPKQPTLEDIVATLPKTKNNEIDYKAMTPQQQYQYTSMTESPKVAMEDLQADIEAGKEEILKTQEQLSKARGGQRAELRDKVRQLTAAQAELEAFAESVMPKQEAAAAEVVEETPVAEAAEETVAEEQQPIVAEEQVGDNGGNQPSEEERNAEGTGNGTQDESETAQAEESIEGSTPFRAKESEGIFDMAERIANEEARRQPLRDRIQQWEEAGIKVNVIENVEDIPNKAAARAVRSGKIVPGWYEESTNQVFIFLPHINDKNDLDLTIIHEAVAHHGMRGLLGDKFDAFLDEVWKTMSAADKAVFINYPGVNGNTRAAADEYIAHLAENIDISESRWSKFTQLVKKFLKAIGIETKVTHADIANALKESFNRLLEGGDVVYQNEQTGQTLYSIRTYRESGRDKLIDFVGKRVQDNALTEEQGAEIVSEMDNIYETVQKYTGVYQPFGTWSEADVAVDESGKPVFSVIKANGEYGMNLDFSLVCKKRRTLDAVFDEMIRRGVISDYELGQVDIAKINAVIREFGFETACRLCFVDAKRFRVAKVADDFCAMYNELASMSDAKLKKIVKNTKKATVRKKTAQHLLEHPEDKVMLSRDNFMSAKGFEGIKINKDAVMRLYNSAKGTGGPKASYGDVQYLNDIAAKQWTPEQAYPVGGVRLQSFSDYVPRMVFDYVQMVADLAAKNLPVHAYTKEPIFAKQFGLTGIKINLSLVPRVDADGVVPGLDKDGNYAWQDGETFPYEEAIAIQNAEGYRENCGTIAVGVSDEHIEKMLGDDNIRMVIPYHKSGLNPAVAKFNNIDKFADYTNEQNTRNSDGKKLNKTQLADMPNFNQQMHDGMTAREAAQTYLDWCDANGYLPKFDKFRNHPNYYKLLEDFTTIVPVEGAENVYPQQGVQMRFPSESDAFGSMDNLIREGLEEDAILEGRRQEKIGDVVDAIEDALGEGTRFRFSKSPEEFDAIQKEAVEKKGIVMPGLNEVVLNVVDVPRHDFEGTGNEAIAKAKEWANSNIVGEHIAKKETPEEFKYIIDSKSIKKYLSGIATKLSDNLGVHLSVLKKLPYVINESIEAEIHADYKKTGERNLENGIDDANLLIHRLYGAVIVNDKLHRVKTTMKEKKNDGIKPYTYEVTKIELIDGSSQNGTSPSDASNNSISATKVLKGVEKSYDKGKYLLDESEKTRFRFIGEKGAANLDKAEEATTRLDNLAVAREMESAEKDAKTIKMATGWERGADGLWRYEVADNLNFDYYANVDYRNRHPELARFEDLRKKLNSSLLMGTDELTEEEQKEFDALEKEFGGYKEYHNSRKLKDYLDTPELFDAYPELRNVELRFIDMDKGTLGKYLPDANTIVLNNSMKLSGRLFNEQVLVHEIQHAIQHIEGFEPGANKNMQDPNKVAQKVHNREFMQKQLDKHIAERDELLKQKDVLNEKMAAWYDSHEEGSSFDDEMNEYNRQYDEIESKLEVADRKVSWDEKWLDATKKAKTELGEEGYAKVTGEVEARNVSRRMKMSDADRRNTLASETEDVAREDQIFLKDGIESGMRFRISDKARQLQAEVDNFTSKYNSKPVVVIDSNMTDKELKRLVGFEAKEVRDAIELGMNSGYNPKTDKIYIMTDNVKDSSDLEDSLFHENLHQYLLSDKSLVVEFFADAEDAYKKNIKQIKEQGYKAYEVPEELFVRVVADSQVKGNFAKVFSFLSEEGKEKLTNLLKENGYDIARETEIRTSGRMDGSGRDGSGRRNGDDFGRVAKESSSMASPSKVEKNGRAREIRQLFDQVADNGLRGVVGDKAYDSAMFEMYRSLPMEARERVAMDALNNHGADMGKAMDKFIGESYNTSFWDIVVGAIRNMLRKKGYDIRFSDNDIRYLVWRNRQKLNRDSILDVAEDIDTRFRLKVGEYEGSPTDGGDTPDGGGTKFKVEDGKMVQNLRDNIASLKEEVANLKKEVRDLRKGSKEEWETKQRAIISFVKGRLTKEAGEELGKTRIEQILTLVTKASNSNDLHKPLQFIEQVINSAIIDSAAARMDKLIKTRLQGETNRGVAKGVVVDEATRRLFDSIRGTFKDLIATSIDSELRHVRGEILRFGKEIKALPEDDTMNRNTLQKQQDALKERRKQLEEEQEELRKKNITETKEWITKRHDELVEAMDAHIEGNGVWTQEMQDEYDSLPLREKLAEIRESQNQMDAILADALMTRREAYMNTGEARKRLLAEADMIESNYSIAQEELIKLMNEVSNELSEIIKGGKERLASRKQMLAERRRMIVGMGIDAVKKRKVHSPNDTLSKEEKFHKWFDNSWLKKVSDFMTAPLNSFNFMLKYVDNNHTIGEGELYKHFMKSKEGALEANNRLYDGLKAYNTTIEEKVKEIFGKDIESVMKDSGKKHDGAVHKQYMYDSANHREGEMYPISISKGEALYVWMTWRQPDGYAKLIYDGWNEQSIAEIEELIGEQYMEFGEWVTDEFFPQLREDKYNKTHIEMFGTSMAKREHYFPFKVYDKDIQEKGEMGESYSGMPSTITGNIIKRTINKSRIDTEKNAFDLIFKYGNDMETWNAMAKLRQDLNFLHSSKAFRNYLEANSKGLYDKFIKSAEVAVKAYNNSGESNAINDFLVKFNRMWAGSNIGFRLNTAMKQILSYPAFTAYSGNPKYQANLAKYMLNWKGNYEWAKEFLPAFRNRIETGDMGMTGMSDPQFDLGKYIRKFSDAGMIPNQLVDALTCAAGARSVYDFEYDRAIKAGLTEEEAENIARYNAEIAFNETQQSSRDEFVSPIQISRNVLIKSMMNYQNSNVGYQRMGNEGLLEIMRAKQVYKEDIKNGMSEADAKKKMANSIARGVRKVVVAFAVLPGLWYLGGRGIVGITAPLISSLFGGGADDEPYLDDEAKEELLLSIALGTVAGTSGGQLIAGLAQGREYNPMAWMNEMQKDIVGAVKNGWNMNVIKNIALRSTKFGGVNIETFENIYLGVEHAIRTGNPDLVDFMMLINLPASQRKAMAEELYSDMPFMEYAEKVSRAQKLFDDYRKHLPYAKSDKTGSKQNSIKKQYIIENMDISKQEELEKEKEFKKLKRDYNSAEDKKEWLEEHPEYKELEKEYADQTITKEVNKKVKELK